MQPRVNILLATYNGSRFLAEQLQSIENQTLSPSLITVRDDGSTDDTISLVEAWGLRDKVSLLKGPRMGATKNFLELLANSDPNSNFFAFCDQDDIWLPDKLERAVAMLASEVETQPAMYCSRVEYVDECLKHLGYSGTPNQLAFANALVENVATGCTVVLNRSARNLVCRIFPRSAMLHDWWCYLVVSATGTVIFDDHPTVKYRQHSNNRVGGSFSLSAALRKRVRRLVEGHGGAHLLIDQAEEFQRCFGELLDTRNKAILERFLSLRCGFWARATYTAAMDVWRQSSIDTAILRTMILLGRV